MIIENAPDIKNMPMPSAINGPVNTFGSNNRIRLRGFFRDVDRLLVHQPLHQDDGHEDGRGPGDEDGVETVGHLYPPPSSGPMAKPTMRMR